MDFPSDSDISNRVMLVFTNVPDSACARTIAGSLVSEGLAACVNQLSPCMSTYRWQDEIQTDEEIPLLIKTTQARLTEVQTRIRELHPYELPEVIAVPITGGLPDYLSWVSDACRASI